MLLIIMPSGLRISLSVRTPLQWRGFREARLTTADGKDGALSVDYEDGATT
jgi:hypothetical protein